MPQREAEVAQRYRERRNADPEGRHAYVQTERESWTRDRQTGKKTGIKELTEKGKQTQKEKWRNGDFCPHSGSKLEQIMY